MPSGHGETSPSSGSSSNTATAMTDVAVRDLLTTGLPLLDRALPVRKRQRKPDKKSKALEIQANSPPTATAHRTRGVKPKTDVLSFALGLTPRVLWAVAVRGLLYISLCLPLAAYASSALLLHCWCSLSF